MSDRTTRVSATTPALVVFASGNGSNFRALCQATVEGRLAARVSALVVNVAGCGAQAIAREYGVPVLEILHSGVPRTAHEATIHQALKGISWDWIVLAGYLRLFDPSFIKRYWDEQLGCAPIVNIHPSLLPAFPGMDGYGQALRYGAKVTGATVHLVGAGLDDGPIVLQKSLEIRDEDTQQTLVARGLQLEHELYVEALSRLLPRKWKLANAGGPEGRQRVAWSKP